MCCNVVIGVWYKDTSHCEFHIMLPHYNVVFSWLILQFMLRNYSRVSSILILLITKF